MKILKRAEVTPAFVDAMQQAYHLWLTHTNKNLTNMSAGSKKATMELHGLTIRRLIPIANGKSPNIREGIDFEITRLRGAKFLTFDTYTHRSSTYLVGTTKHISTHDYISKEIIAELGCYRIFLPLSIFIKPDLSSIHMIPMRNMKSYNRHFHHYVIPETGGHPLELKTGNCYGSYSTIISTLMSTPDLPALFMTLYNHLSTRGNSPPKRLNDLDFDTTTPEAA